MQENEGPISEALRKAIAKSKRTPCSIAREAGIDPAPIYRFLARTAQLKLSSVDALCRVLSLEVKAAKRAKAKPAAAEQSDDDFNKELSRMVNRTMGTAAKRKTAKAG